MLIRSPPCRPIISPWVMYFRRFSRILPRMICLKRVRSPWMFIDMGQALDLSRRPDGRREGRTASGAGGQAFAQVSVRLGVSAGKDAGHVVQHVRGALFVVAVVADEAALD